MPAGFMLPPGYAMAQLRERNKDDKVSLWIGTQEEFKQLDKIDNGVMYFFTDDPMVEVLNTLCNIDNATDNYTPVWYFTTVTGGEQNHSEKVPAGMYMVRVKHRTSGSVASFMMDFSGTATYYSPIFPYVASDGSIKQGLVKASRVSGEPAGIYSLTPYDAATGTTGYSDFEIRVRRIGEQYAIG